MLALNYLSMLFDLSFKICEFIGSMWWCNSDIDDGENINDGKDIDETDGDFYNGRDVNDGEDIKRWRCMRHQP